MGCISKNGENIREQVRDMDFDYENTEQRAIEDGDIEYEK